MPRAQVPPWAHGPAELFRHADEHLVADGDTDRRLAMIGFDNAIEVCVDTFVGLHPRNRGGYEIPREAREVALRNYHTKLAFLETYAAERALSLDDVPIDAVVWYHQLRNELYHSGNGMTPERQHVIGIRNAARGVFRALFNCDVAEVEEIPVDAPNALEAPVDGSENLAFLGTYIKFDRTISQRSVASKNSYLSQKWQLYRDINPWAQEYDDVVAAARTTRNSLVHGEDVTEHGLTDATVAQLSNRLSELTNLIATRPLGPEPGKAARELRGRRLAEAAYESAVRSDPGQKGLSMLEIIDLVVDAGVTIGGRVPGRVTYDALKTAQDLFGRDSRGRWCWLDRGAIIAGLSGRHLLAAVSTECDWMNQLPEGRHYQDVIARLTARGLEIRGPDRGRTMYSVLANGPGRRAFVRVGRGRFRCLAP